MRSLLLILALWALICLAGCGDSEVRTYRLTITRSDGTVQTNEITTSDRVPWIVVVSKDNGTIVLDTLTAPQNRWSIRPEDYFSIVVVKSGAEVR
jgi:hypothetical protein